MQRKISEKKILTFETRSDIQRTCTVELIIIGHRFMEHTI